MRMRCAAAISILLALLFFAAPRPARAQASPSRTPPLPLPEAGQQSPFPARLPCPKEINAALRVGFSNLANKIVRYVPPVYPQIAVMAHVSGTVTLCATIARDGTVRKLIFLSGPALLREAAMRAVGQWEFRVTDLDGFPVEVETTIPVSFFLPEWRHTFKFTVTQPGSSRIILTEDIDLGGSGKRQSWDDWITAFEAETARAWLDGASSVASSKKGKVTVQFALRSDGTIDGVFGVTQSSGDSVVDYATRLAIQRCEPFQALPPNPHYSSADVRITFAYDHPHPVTPSAGATK